MKEVELEGREVRVSGEQGLEPWMGTEDWPRKHLRWQDPERQERESVLGRGSCPRSQRDLRSRRAAGKPSHIHRSRWAHVTPRGTPFTWLPMVFAGAGDREGEAV